MTHFIPALAGLLPHPPIVIREVGRERLAQCQATHDACREFAERLVRARPDRLFLVSPHSPRAGRAFGFWSGNRLRGDLARFGAPMASVDLPNDKEAVERLRTAVLRQGLAFEPIRERALDHGAVVPLLFLAATGFAGPTCVVAPPGDGAGLIAFGQAVAAAYASLPGKAAIVASGDMSHRVTRDAPAGYHPRGIEFDHIVRDLVAAGRLDGIPEVDAALRDDAGEDTTEAATIVAATLGFRAHGAAVLSYEHPFGVGYLVAVFHDGQLETSGAYLETLPALAREAIRARLDGRKPRLPAATGGLARRAPVFVTLKTRDGALRGCMGSLRPMSVDLVAETADRAVTAAFQDPRFPPLTTDELERVVIEVSVLGPDEPVESVTDLDTDRYGIIVTDECDRRGVLLPAIEGVDSVAAQIAIARRKAGIPEGHEIRIRRFRVEKACERSAGEA